MFLASQIQSWLTARVENSSTSVKPFEERVITGIANLCDAKPDEVAFFFSPTYQTDLMNTRAGLVVTGDAMIQPILASGLPVLKTCTFLVVSDPYRAMGIASGRFSQKLSQHDHQRDGSQWGAAKIHPQATVDPTAKIADGVVIYPHVYVGPNCVVGEGTVLFPSVTLYEGTTIGKRCRIHAGAVIGSDGFGYAPIVKDKLPVGHQKIYHLGGVTIEDDVEIGANTCIDRGTMGQTIIRSQVKIDNLVQIGHNCEIGEGSILCGAAAMSGSSSLGKFVVVGGQSGAGNKIHIGDYAKLAAYTGAGKDVAPGAEMGGVPARPLSEYYRILALQSKLLKQQRKKS